MRIVEYENYPNYCEYQELFDSYTYEELKLSYDALFDKDLSDSLYEAESPLIIFQIDTDLQEKLHLFFEDQRNYRSILDEDFR